jgi:hypothetical protein
MYTSYQRGKMADEGRSGTDLEAVVVQSRYHYGICLEVLNKNHEEYR